MVATGPKPGAYYNYEPAPTEILSRVEAIEKICADHGVPLVNAAFQFPLRHPSVVSVIPGGQGLTEMNSNLEAARAVIPEGLWADIKAAGLMREDVP